MSSKTRGNRGPRRLRLESLERRALMAGDVVENAAVAPPPQEPLADFPPSSKSWQNEANPLDVNGDGVVTKVDAQLILDELNRTGPRPLYHSHCLTDGEGRISACTADLMLPGPTWPRYDVNGDGFIAPIDAQLVLNALKRQSAGESPDAAIVPDDCSLEPESPTAASQSTGASGPIAASAVDAPLDEPSAPSEERSIALPPAGASATSDEAKDAADESLDTSCVDSVFESLGAEGTDGAAGQHALAVASVSLEFPWAVDEELGTPLDEEGL